MAVGAPAASRTTSKTENGRRSRVSVMSAGRTITNWPARSSLPPPAQTGSTRCSRVTAAGSRSRWRPRRWAASGQYSLPGVGSSGSRESNSTCRMPDSLAARPRSDSAPLAADSRPTPGSRLAGSRLPVRFLYNRPVRYLRMLSNSVIAGGLAAGYLAVLVLQLNPQYTIDPGTIRRWRLMLGAAYGLNLTAVFYALIVIRQILAVEVLSPGWLSVRLLSWLFTMAAAGGATVMWLNLRGFGPVLDVETTRRMAAGAIVVTAAGGGVPDDCGRAHQPPRWTGERDDSGAHGAHLGGHADRAARTRASTAAAAARAAARAAPGRGAAERWTARAADAGRRVARRHRAGGGPGPAPELRPHRRRRLGHAPGDAPADPGRTGLERGGHGPRADADRGPIVGLVSRARASRP